MLLTAITAAAIALCPATGPRDHCVHDGDTFWWHGEKIRIATIDTPELDSARPEDRRRAIRARDRLVELLNRDGVQILRCGTDRFGRTLAVVSPAGRQLIAEGLARPWRRISPECQQALDRAAG